MKPYFSGVPLRFTQLNRFLLLFNRGSVIKSEGNNVPHYNLGHGKLLLLPTSPSSHTFHIRKMEKLRNLRTSRLFTALLKVTRVKRRLDPFTKKDCLFLIGYPDPEKPKILRVLRAFAVQYFLCLSIVNQQSSIPMRPPLYGPRRS